MKHATDWRGEHLIRTPKREPETGRVINWINHDAIHSALTADWQLVADIADAVGETRQRAYSGLERLLVAGRARVRRKAHTTYWRRA